MIDTVALREKVLDLAIRGKLVPQDPNDEPASVLLDRIRAQKQQMVKDGKLKAKDIKDDSIIFVGEDNLHYEKFDDGTVKCIEDEIPFELPASWNWCRLGVLFAHNTGKALNSSDTAGTKLTYITTSNLYWDRFELDNLKEMPFTESEIEKCTVKKGDLLVCEGGDIGRSAIWSFDEEIRIQNHIHRLRSYTDLSNKFYYYVLFLWKRLERIGGQGIGLQGFSSKALHKLIVPLPPHKEQITIVEKLDSILDSVDNLDELNSEFTIDVQSVKKQILDLAIRGKLVSQSPGDEPASALLERIRSEKEELIKQGKIKRDKKGSVIFKGEDNSYYEKIGDSIVEITDEIPFELPGNCLFVRFKDVWELLSGRDLAPGDYNDQGEGIPYITGASNFFNETVAISRWTNSPQVVTKVGDLLITCKGTVGETAFNTFGDAHIARQIMAMRNNYHLNIEYLSLCIKYYIESLKTIAKGLIPGISRDDILNLILPMPSETYQTSVVNRVNELFEIIEHIKKSLS